MHLTNIHLLSDKYPTREKYPFTLDFLWQTPSVTFDTPVTFFIGENGTGKSTLLKAITRRCGVYIWANEETRRFQFNRFEDKLHHCLEITWADEPVPGAFFASEHFQFFAECLDDWAVSDPGSLKYFGGQSLLTQSHGQSLMSYFGSQFRRKGVFFLDEPETALSPTRQLELLRLLIDAGQIGQSQFIIATHSPILMSCPGATIYSFDATPLQKVAYEDTEHYRVYKEFMADPGKFTA